jgi:hypothetical protein
LRQIGRRVCGCADQRQTTLEQHQAFDLFGKGAGKQSRDSRAARMSKQVESFPSELPGKLEHIADVLPDVVTGVDGAVATQTVTGSVKSDDVTAVETGRKQ